MMSLMLHCRYALRELTEMLTVIFTSFRVLYVDRNHFPISLPLINHGQDPKYLHFDYLTTRAHLEGSF